MQKRSSFNDSDKELDGFFWRPEKIGWLLVIKGYFDESFDRQSEVTWVAGHLGDEVAWTSYVNNWRFGLGKRKHLHMHSLRWKSPSVPQLLSRLAPIPAQSGLQAITGGICTKDVADLIKGTRLEYHSNGYLISLASVTTQAIMCVPDNEHLEVVFEDRDQTRERANDALFAMHIMAYLAKSDPSLRNSDGSVKLIKGRLMRKDGMILFDQADYLCHALMQHHRNPESQKARWSAPILIASGVSDGKLLSRNEARTLIQQLLAARA